MRPTLNRKARDLHLRGPSVSTQTTKAGGSLQRAVARPERVIALDASLAEGCRNLPTPPDLPTGKACRLLGGDPDLLLEVQIKALKRTSGSRGETDQP